MTLTRDVTGVPAVAPGKWPGVEVPDGLTSDEPGLRFTAWGTEIVESAAFMTWTCGFTDGCTVGEEMLKRIKLGWRVFDNWPRRRMFDDTARYATDDEIRACVLGLKTNAGVRRDSEFLTMLLEVK